MELLRHTLGTSASLLAWEPDETGVTVRIASEKAFDGAILFRHDAPLRIERTAQVTAALAYCNDRYGHQVWELSLSGPRVAQAEVRLAVIPPPSAPLAETPDDFAAFQREFASRPSRFPDDSAEAFVAWQAETRQKVWGWLCGGVRPARTVSTVERTVVQEGEAFRIERLLYWSQPDREVKALLALPAEARQAPVPLVLALHGHEATWGEAALEAFLPGHADDFCHHFASQGFAVLQPPTMNHQLQRADWTLYGEWLWDALTGLDALAGWPEIDLDRISVVGLSTGGHLALLASALDERIQNAVVAGIFSTRNHIRKRFRIPPHCDCGSSRTLFAHLEPSDLAALIAPRRLQLQHGRQDHVMCPGADPARLDLRWNTGVMPPEEFDVAVREVQRAYQRVAVPERFAVHLHPGGHAVDSGAALAWVQAAKGTP